MADQSAGGKGNKESHATRCSPTIGGSVREQAQTALGHDSLVLETAVKRPSERNRRSTQMDNMKDAVWLHKYQESEATVCHHAGARLAWTSLTKARKLQFVIPLWCQNGQKQPVQKWAYKRSLEPKTTVAGRRRIEVGILLEIAEWATSSSSSMELPTFIDLGLRMIDYTWKRWAATSFSDATESDTASPWCCSNGGKELVRASVLFICTIPFAPN